MTIREHASLLDVASLDAASIAERLVPPRALGRPYVIALAVTGTLTALLMGLGLYTILTGIGTWGNHIPVAWAFGITNFVFWIGIGHAGTFISAVLLLFGQPWRSSINRIAESMTLFAVMIAGLFPLFHLGRAWFFYWLVPYPATTGVWPQFMSPLNWDVVAISTYFLVSLLFWYLGLVPDLALLRDRPGPTWARRVYGVFAMGFRGSAREHRHYRAAQIVLAGLATPLVVSVHSIVSMDFAVGVLPGWHSTIFPPYFVAGAIFSGFAMVLTIVIPLRRILGYEPFITARHLDLMAQTMLATGLLVAYSYAVEIFIAWYSADPFERRLYLEVRPFGTYAFAFWTMIACNVVAPQLLWFRRIRRSEVALFILSVLVNVGMWTERFVLIVTSQARDFLPASGRDFVPSLIDGGLLLGTFGMLLFLMLAVTRAIPLISITETRELYDELKGGER